MKKEFMLIALFLLLPTVIFSQPFTVDIKTDQSIVELDLGSLVVSNNLRGAPRIFAVYITPDGQEVKLKGYIFWQKSVDEDFELIFSYQTAPFTSRTIFNTDLGNGVEIEKTERYNDDLIDELRRRNKPTGTLRFTVQLLDSQNNIVAEDNDESGDNDITFENPAQTLAIISPEPKSTQNIGGVTAEWTALNGIEYYTIKANLRKNKSSSLEEALESGDPIINDANVGPVTSAELRSLLDREWLPGDEIVLQVAAHPFGGGNSEIIYSDIVNFFLDDPSDPVNQKQNRGIVIILQKLQGGLGSELLDKLLTGEIKIKDIVWGDTGLPLSPEELEELLNYLSNNQGNIIDIRRD